jgi:hypothetical protein
MGRNDLGQGLLARGELALDQEFLGQRGRGLRVGRGRPADGRNDWDLEESSSNHRVTSHTTRSAPRWCHRLRKDSRLRRRARFFYISLDDPGTCREISGSVGWTGPKSGIQRRLNESTQRGKRGSADGAASTRRPEDPAFVGAGSVRRLLIALSPSRGSIEEAEGFRVPKPAAWGSEGVIRGG